MKWIRHQAALRPFAALFVLFLLAGTAPAQSPPDTASGSVAPPQLEAGAVPADTLRSDSLGIAFARSRVKFFSVDHAVLRFDGEQNLLEVFALVDRMLLGNRMVDSSSFQAAYEITFQVMDTSGAVVTNDVWVSTNTVRDTVEEVAGKKIPEMTRFLVEPGEYRVAARVVDLVARTWYVVHYPVTVRPIPGGQLASSDIILASRLETAQGDVGPFDHNGLLVLPNADRMFGQSNPLVYYYAELYGLTTAGEATYTVRRQIVNDRRDVVKSLPPRNRQTQAEDLVEMGAFNVATLRSGSYSLKLFVTDDATGDTTTAERTFWVYRPEQQDRVVPLEDPGFDISTLSDEEVALELKQARYIMTSALQNRLKHFETPEAKRNFLAAFWASLNPEKETGINEARKVFLDRRNEANERFGSLQKEGWNTDRGRVYIQHGEPSQVEYHPFDQNVASAYEIWHYDQLEGGVIYVFVDRNNYGDYVLVHSTKRGEMSNVDWYQDELRGF